MEHVLTLVRFELQISANGHVQYVHGFLRSPFVCQGRSGVREQWDSEIMIFERRNDNHLLPLGADRAKSGVRSVDVCDRYD